MVGNNVPRLTGSERRSDSGLRAAPVFGAFRAATYDVDSACSTQNPREKGTRRRQLGNDDGHLRRRRCSVAMCARVMGAAWEIDCALAW
jgi:hypothetical protein